MKQKSAPPTTPATTTSGSKRQVPRKPDVSKALAAANDLATSATQAAKKQKPKRSSGCGCGW